VADVAGAVVGGVSLTVHERVREWIRGAVASGELVPGERLVQSEIAKRLSVSVTPVREAMRDLAAEGVIRFDSRRGATVTQIAVTDIEEAILMHSALEPVWAKLAVARIEDDELIRAEGMQNLMEDSAELSSYRARNREFHTYLYTLAHAQRLSATLTGLRDSVDVAMSMTFSIGSARYLQGLQEHRDLLAALRRRDAKAAGRIASDHVCITLRNAIVMVSSGVESTSADV
jgi:DNA-binding GntR family transcriptional regulator